MASPIAFCVFGLLSPVFVFCPFDREAFSISMLPLRRIPRRNLPRIEKIKHPHEPYRIAIIRSFWIKYEAVKKIENPMNPNRQKKNLASSLSIIINFGKKRTLLHITLLEMFLRSFDLELRS